MISLVRRNYNKNFPEDIRFGTRPKDATINGVAHALDHTHKTRIGMKREQDKRAIASDTLGKCRLRRYSIRICVCMYVCVYMLSLYECRMCNANTHTFTPNATP